MAQDGATEVYGSGVLAGSLTSGGSLYVNGVYVDVPLTGGSGSNARATVTVSGNVVSGVFITNEGVGYTVGNNLSASNANLGGSGSGFTFTVSALTKLASGATLDLCINSVSTANGTFTPIVVGNVSASNNGLDFADTNTTLNNLLPPQTGNSGFVLGTNGANSFWSSAVPSGMVAMFPVNTAPAGWLETNGVLVSRSSYPNLYSFAASSGNISSVDTTTINTGAILNAGTGYVAGTYTGISVTGGSGSGAVATVVVGSSGTVTSFTLTTNPTLTAESSYVVGDLLSCPTASIGGSGSGFQWQVQSVTGWDKGMFSVGNGSTTFRIPDLRGMFIRDWSDTGSIDSGRAIGTSQVDQFQSHGHAASSSDSGHTHVVPTQNGATPSTNAANNSAGGSNSNTTTQAGYANITTTVSAPNSGSYGSETRPKNIALMYCIKT